VSLNEKALEYHSQGRKGKIKVVPTKPCITAEDLSLAYSPGVAAPCLEIAKNPDDAYRYTAKGNLVAVISNGSAVLGLGNIGALAGKPVMEGKGVLFKRFADIDVFDIEIDTQDTQEIIRFCEMIAPTFGGINLEDIRAPECFEIETALKQSLDIPVFHDDQHGTAIITAAALLNACEIQDKKVEDVKVVFSGAGAAALSCAKLYKDIGVKAENILMTDSRGVMYKGRGEGLNKYKEEFVVDTSARTLADALVGADVFAGLSQAGLVTKEMVESMADKPIIFAMANPDPEITPVDAKQARSDAICATGRSDYANQVNNVLGFPFIFRGALDVRASKINEEMKLAATLALAELAKRGEAVPQAVKTAYPGESFDFGPEYIIPKPFDPRVLLYVAPAVAKAAMDTGVARKPVDLLEYEAKLQQMLGEIASL
jgi:malate dehydrogenase (oxaloacetate-decarboxylating)(NADP+)